MKKFLRKPLIYLLTTMMIMPTWLMTGLTSAQKARAADTVLLSEGFDGYDGTLGTVPAGWTFNGVEIYPSGSGVKGVSAPSLKLVETGDSVQTKMFSGASLLRFWTRGMSISSDSALRIEGYDGSNWNTIKVLTTISNSAASHALDLSNDVQSVRFVYNKVSGNLALDDITVIASDGADITAPTLTSVTVSSDNANPAFAKVDDTIKLRITSDEAINTPVVTIASHAATVTGSGMSFEATYKMTESDIEGVVPFSIGYSDLAGNSGLTVTGTTDASKVTFLKNSLAFSKVGFTSDGNSVAGNVTDGFYLTTDGSALSENLIQFSDDTESNQPIKAGVYGLFLQPTVGQAELLQSYYASKPEPWKSYLDAAALGSQAIAYIKSDGTDKPTLIDGARYALASLESDLVIPGDYPEGIYIVTGKIKDVFGSETDVAFKLVIDRTAPAIVLNGGSDINVALNSDYVEGATALDNIDGDISDKIVTFGTVDASVIGEYTLTYNVSDAAGNSATPVIRKVHVIEVPASGITIDQLVTNKVSPELTGKIDGMAASIGVTVNGNDYLATISTDNTAWNLPAGTIKPDLSEGIYDIIVKAFDADKNILATDETKDELTVDLTASVPAVKAEISDKTVKLTWTDEATDTVSYNIYSGLTTDTLSLRAIGLVRKDYSLSFSEYGKYVIVVMAVDKLGNLTAKTATANLVNVELTAPAIVAAPVAEATPILTPAPSKAKAAAPAPAQNSTPAPDSKGVIKGDDTNTADNAGNDINWTPWIVLFTLILLAGAATGGYFYWFAGKEEGETDVRAAEVKKVEKVIEEKKPVVVVRDRSKKNNKKGKRW